MSKGIIQNKKLSICLIVLILVLPTFAGDTSVLSVSAVKSFEETFTEPFKDFFDYEWWLPGSEYGGKGYQYGKWTCLDIFWNGAPKQLMYISEDNPITGTDSAVVEVDGSSTIPNSWAWRGLWNSPDPERLIYPNVLNPAYMRFRFRLDEWITNEPSAWPWRVTLAALCGGYIHFYAVVCIGLEGAASELPHLMLWTRKDATGVEDGGYGELFEKISSTTIELDRVYTLEFMRLQDPNGLVKVFLDDAEIPDLTCEDIDTSYPGIHEIALGNRVQEGDNYFGRGGATGSYCKITFDDFRMRNEYIGAGALPTNLYNLTIDSSPQGKTVRVGNWIVGQTPVTIKVPEGTVPKVGIDPINFDHWEIEGSPDYSSETKNLVSTYSEYWPTMDPSLITVMTRAPAEGGANMGPKVMPAIYQDTRITAMYTTGTQHILNISSDPVVTSFTVDGLAYSTPWSNSLTEGAHTIAIPSTFIVGIKKYDFRNWEDKSTNPTRTVNLVMDMNITVYYNVTIIPEFPTLIAWLTVVGVATFVIVLGAKKLRVHSKTSPFSLSRRYLLVFACEYWFP